MELQKAETHPSAVSWGQDAPWFLTVGERVASPVPGAMGNQVQNTESPPSQ